VRSQPCERVSTRSGAIFDYDTKRDRLIEVSAELERNEVWNDPERAQNLGRERARLEDVVHTLDRVDAGLRDAGELLELAQAEGDVKTLAEIERDLAALAKTAADMEFKRMFSGEMDAHNAYLDIQAG
jgi:peptide chain release factor 2